MILHLIKKFKLWIKQFSAELAFIIVTLQIDCSQRGIVCVIALRLFKKTLVHVLKMVID